jgi:hypothetical protein
MKVIKEIGFSEVVDSYVSFAKSCYNVLAIVQLPKPLPCEWDQHSADYTPCGKPALYAHAAILFDKPVLQVVCDEHVRGGFHNLEIPERHAKQ